MIEPVELAAATLSALCLMALFRTLVPARTRLAARVRPYTLGSRSILGAGADLRGATSAGLGSVVDVFKPMIQRIARHVGGVIDRMSDESLQLRLRQAGMYPDLDERDRVSAYRLTQLRTLLLWTAAAFVGATSLGFPPARGAVFVALAAIVGATRQRGKLDRTIDSRREMMRIEVYTINQLLAMRVRAGGGVVSAVGDLVRRGNGSVVMELAEALRLHRAGTRAADAFARIAALTPEPFCARTYSLLAVAEDRGVDLAGGLLALAEDVREARREAIRRSATKRRAAMLIPTIVILAPVMLLFVGAPLPSLLLGFR